MKAWNNGVPLRSPLVSPKVRLDFTRHQRAAAIRTDHLSGHTTAVDYGLQRRLEGQRNAQDRKCLEDELKLLATHRVQRYRRPTVRRTEFPLEPDCEEIKELREIAEHLNCLTNSQFGRTQTDTTAASLHSKLVSPSHRDSSPQPSAQSFNSPPQSQSTQPYSKSDFSLRHIKALRLQSTLTPTPYLTTKPLPKAGVIFTECEEEAVLPLHLRDFSPPTPCPTIDFPAFCSLSPADRADRRKVYWKQRVQKDFIPKISLRAKALNEIRAQEKEPRRPIRRIRLEELSF